VSRPQVLVAEDDRVVSLLIARSLEGVGAQTTTVYDGLEAFEVGLTTDFNLVLLDQVMPGLLGVEVLQRWIDDGKDMPVIMVSALTAEEDIVRCLELGAVDFIRKPFSVRELVARVKALFRRVEALESHSPEADDHGPIQRGPLVIDPERRRVHIDEREVSLTAKEFDLLLHFARAPGKVFNRVQLLDQVWGYNHEGYEHTVNSHINRLRAKIESDPSDPCYIETVWGVGYRFPEDAGTTS